MATRILQPSSNPYAGGAVIFDSSPYANLYIQQVQREAAKDEALDKYFLEWGKSINPAGMRVQDTQSLLNSINESRDFYFKNKKAIKNPALDGGKAYSEYMGRRNGEMALINNSKQFAQKQELFNRNLLAARQKGMPIADNTLVKIDRFNLPLTDPNWQDLNAEDIEFQSKPLDLAKFTRVIYGDTKLGERIAGEKKVPESFEKITTFETFLDENELPKIESRAVAEYMSDGSFQEFIDGLSLNPSEVSRLNSIYKDKYKKDISNQKDLAVAFALSLSPAGKSREVRTKDVAAELAAREQNIRTRPSKARGGSGSGGSFGGGNLLDTFGSVQRLKTPQGLSVENGMAFNQEGSPYTGIIKVNRADVPSQIYQVLKSAGTNSDLLFINKGFDLVFKDGKIEAIKSPDLGVITRQMIENAQKKFDTERKGESMTFQPQTTTTPKTTTKFKNIPKGGF